MTRLSFLFVLFSVVALLVLGASGAWASAEPMPCHETGPAMITDADSGAPVNAPAQSPAKAMVMACCVACVAPPVAVPGPSPSVETPPLAVQPSLSDLPTGRSPSPEPGPPKA